MELPVDPNNGIILKEYGRNIQKLVDYILTIEDRDKRSRYARTLIELMKQINPSMRDAQDSYHKLWDHLYIMSDFQLEVDTPYPMPDKSVIGKKPMRVAYNMNLLSYKHYGKNIELLISKAIEVKDPEEQEAAVLYVGRLMKRFYASWNKENIDDDVIIEHLAQMSKNKLPIPIEKIKSQNLFDSIQKEYKDYRNNSNQGGGGNSGGGNNYNSGGGGNNYNSGGGNNYNSGGGNNYNSGGGSNSNYKKRPQGSNNNNNSGNNNNNFNNNRRRNGYNGHNNN